MPNTIKSTLSSVRSLGEFFGVPLTTVASFNIMIAIYANKPDWLESIWKEDDLPRRLRAASLPYQYVVPATEGQRALLADWIVENCQGGWDINNRFVSFESDVDAVQYRLRWC